MRPASPASSSGRAGAGWPGPRGRPAAAARGASDRPAQIGAPTGPHPRAAAAAGRAGASASTDAAGSRRRHARRSSRSSAAVLPGQGHLHHCEPRAHRGGQPHGVSWRGDGDGAQPRACASTESISAPPKRWWSGNSAAPASVAPASRRVAWNLAGRAMPEKANTRRRRAAAPGRHQLGAQHGQVRHRGQCAGLIPADQHRGLAAPGRSCAGSRKGPAGTTRPLPKPTARRSRATTGLDQVRVLQPVIHHQHLRPGRDRRTGRRSPVPRDPGRRHCRQQQGLVPHQRRLMRRRVTRSTPRRSPP